MSVKQAIIKRIKKVKLTTRITLSNVILFSLLIFLIMYFITLLTSQFLNIRNRDDLIAKQQQVSELLKIEGESIVDIAPRERISYIYQKFENYYILDSRKAIMLVYDTENHTSYGLDKDFYDILFMNQLKTNPRDVRIQVSYQPSSGMVQDKAIFDFYPRSLKSSQKSLFHLPLDVPSVNGTPFITKAEILGYDLMYTTIRHDLPDGFTIFVSIFLYPDYDNNFLLSLNSALLISALLGILFLTLFGSMFTKKALKPLMELTEIAENINNETLNYRIPPTDSNDEVDALIKSLNTMLENLEQAFENQKRFVSDASHELRIPLTIVLGYIDLLKAIGTEDKALLSESLIAIEDESKHMKNMVEKLLVLARLENQRLKIVQTWFDVGTYLEKTTEECSRLYHTHTFKSDIQYDDLIHTDEEMLTQILRALVENAVKYSAENTVITLQSIHKNKFIELSVIDHGKGVSKDSIQKLTHRFYRQHEDRNRNSGGSGLGLSIVEAFIKVLGGHMRIESDIGVGTKASVYLPKE